MLATFLSTVSYTVSTYSAASGIRKDKINANLHIHFGVVLHEPVTGSADEASGASDNEKNVANE